jgi:hypothetical protein
MDCPAWLRATHGFARRFGKGALRMILFVRRHLTYANVVATLALVFAMGGTAIAAGHYLITSTSQISPKVLKALEVKVAAGVHAGPAGKEGAAGPAGAAGKAGESGAKGEIGSTGETGPKGDQGVKGEQGIQGIKGEQGLSTLSAAEQKKLTEILPYVQLVASGVDGKPTIQFVGANVQIVDGSGETKSVNGTGNLVIGYDETPGVQTGSHNILLGGGGQGDEGYGSLIGGAGNTETSTAPFSLLFGQGNTASGIGSTVTGGFNNLAEGKDSSVSGGEEDKAGGEYAAVSGGAANSAEGLAASTQGGRVNDAAGPYSSVAGGHEQGEGTEYGFLP